MGANGNTAAITEDLTARNVRVAAISARKLHGITFINLLLPVAPAKITVSLPASIGPQHIPAKLTELCARVRHEVITTLVQQGIPARGVELSLDWRERWVGGK